MNINRKETLQRQLNYQFKNAALFRQALTHRSADKKHNERLEFLGDAILSFVIAEHLYHKFPAVTEGDLTQMRSTLVCGEMLAKIGKGFNLGDSIILGSGEMKTGGHRRDSIIADAVEALIGAIYLDSDLETVKPLILVWLAKEINQIQPGVKQKDPKTLLQEYLQARRLPLPEYLILDITGDEHNQSFLVRCVLENDSAEYLGKGSTRRKAEQNAASLVIEKRGIQNGK